jgi:hypothetical protein
MEDNIRRVPRPQGLTNIGHTLYKEPNNQNKAHLRNTLIKAYISDNLYWLYKKVTHISVEDKEAMKQAQALKKKETPAQLKHKKNSRKKKDKPIKLYKELYVEEVKRIELSDLALFLGLSEAKLIQRLEKAYHKEGSIMADTQGKINAQSLARVAISGLFFKSLDKASSQSDWASEIQAVTRLRNYSPAMIMATNAAMTQETQALGLSLRIATMLGGTGDPKGAVPASPTVNIQNNMGTVPANIGGQILTPTMAQKMLSEAGLTTQPLDLQGLALLHGINDGSLPEIEATPSDAQGINLPDLTHLGFTDSGLDSLDEPKKDHTNRRAESLDIVDGLVE